MLAIAGLVYIVSLLVQLVSLLVRLAQGIAGHSGAIALNLANAYGQNDRL